MMGFSPRPFDLIEHVIERRRRNDRIMKRLGEALSPSEICRIVQRGLDSLRVLRICAQFRRDIAHERYVLCAHRYLDPLHAARLQAFAAVLEGFCTRVHFRN